MMDLIKMTWIWESEVVVLISCILTPVWYRWLWEFQTGENKVKGQMLSKSDFLANTFLYSATY